MTLPDLNLNRRNVRSALRAIDEHFDAVATEIAAGGGGGEAAGFTYPAASEVFTGNRWIDGNRIMRKYVNIGALPNSTTKTVSFGVTGMLRMLGIWGTAWRADGVSTVLPAVNITGLVASTVLIWFSLDDSVRIVTTADMSAFTGLVIAEYVKV